MEVTKSNGNKMSDWLVIGEGLGSDQSHELIFGLNNNETVKEVNVTYADGTKQVVESPTINSTLIIKEVVTPLTNPELKI